MTRTRWRRRSTAASSGERAILLAEPGWASRIPARLPPGGSSDGGPLKLRAELADAMIAHARADLPNECCGMIAGREGAATRVHRAANTERSPFMYVMEPREQLRIWDEIEAAGDDVLAVYHSHTRSAAYPSRTDVELAFFPDTLYVIVSLADREAPVIRAFRIRRDAPEGEAITEEPVQTG